MTNIISKDHQCPYRSKYLDEELQLYLISKIDDKISSGCWEWIGSKNGGGYGRVGGSSKWIKKYSKAGAHQLAYIAWNGIYPKELFVCHKCHNRKCFNPRHLYVGTAKTNSIDMINSGRSNSKPPILLGSKNPNTKLTEAEVKLIKSLLGKISIRKLAAMFGVGKSAIFQIKSGISWGYINEYY